jgi:hypothetical protein
MSLCAAAFRHGSKQFWQYEGTIAKGSLPFGSARQPVAK